MQSYRTCIQKTNENDMTDFLKTTPCKDMQNINIYMHAQTHTYVYMQHAFILFLSTWGYNRRHSHVYNLHLPLPTPAPLSPLVFNFTDGLVKREKVDNIHDLEKT